MKKNSFKSALCTLIVGVAMLSGCSTANDDKTLITFSNNSWDSQRLHNEIAKFIVENGFDGYRVELSTANSTMNWQAILKGDVDLDIESWTDNVATYAADVARGDIVELGTLVPDSAQGFYVPRYVLEGDAKRNIKPLAPDLKHVKDLINYSDVFENPEDDERGRIYGAIPGWMIDEVMHNKYIHYNLDEKYDYTRLGSEAALYASLEAAYNKGEGWVGYAFEPTLISGKLDLVRLEDEPYKESVFMLGECEVPIQKLKIVSSRLFAKKAPDLVPFFEKYQTGSAVIASALVHLDKSKESHEDTAKWLMNENPQLLDQWLTKEQASKVREALK